MKVCVIGTGYVGLVTGTVLAHLGHSVTCIDIDQSKIDLLLAGHIPIKEPGLTGLVERHSGNRLSFVHQPIQLVHEADLVMVAVGTPPGINGYPDLSAFWQAIFTTLPQMKDDSILLIKSTVPVGTARQVAQWIKQHLTKNKAISVVNNPEFLREGSAVFDSFHPDRIVFGGENAQALERASQLYEGINAPLLVTSWDTAELIKYGSNAFLALKISYINELAQICEGYGIDVNEVSKGIGADNRIGPHFLNAGVGYGGSCLPKDLSALIHMARSKAVTPVLLEATAQVNTRQPERLVEKLEQVLGSLQGRKIGLWGLAFKAGTDDVRESPALKILFLLLAKGASVTVYDPAALDKAAPLLPPEVHLAPDMYGAAKEGDALIVATDWEEFREASFSGLRPIMAQPVIVDGRNCLDTNALHSHGFRYVGMGR